MSKKLDDIIKLIKANKFETAEKYTLKLIDEKPSDNKIKNIYGIILSIKGDKDKALSIFKEIELENPFFKDTLLNIANVYNEKLEYNNRLIYLERYLKLDPDNVEIIHQLAKTYDYLYKYSDSEKIYHQLSKTLDNELFLLDYSHNQANNNNLDFAESLAKKAFILNNNNIFALLQLGNIEIKKGNFESAELFFLKAKKIDSSNHVVYFYFGLLSEQTGNLKLAKKYYEKSLTIKKNYKSSKYNLTLLNLNLKNFYSGWKDYDLRDHNQKFINFIKNNSLTIWDSKDKNNKVLFHQEQGLGDQVLFGSILNDLFRFNKNSIVELDQRLIKLYRRTYPSIEFINNTDESLKNKDIKHYTLGGIGKIFRKKEDDFKNFKKLIPDDKLVSEYKKLLKLHKGIKVGISWAKYSKNDPLMKKSFDILKLSKILDYKKFKLVNLQYGDIEKDILRLKDNQNRNILTIDDINYTNDIDKVAALMCACDLVISIESFAAILSASLGLKTYVLSHIIQNFVWIKDNKNNSLWFPEAKVLKQNKTNEWIYVEKLLSNELANNF